MKEIILVHLIHHTRQLLRHHRVSAHCLSTVQGKVRTYMYTVSLVRVCFDCHVA